MPSQAHLRRGHAHHFFRFRRACVGIRNLRSWMSSIDCSTVLQKCPCNSFSGTDRAAGEGDRDRSEHNNNPLPLEHFLIDITIRISLLNCSTHSIRLSVLPKVVTKIPNYRDVISLSHSGPAPDNPFVEKSDILPYDMVLFIMKCLVMPCDSEEWLRV